MNVDQVVKYTIEEHIEIIQSPENIQKAIRDYQLDVLYAQESNPLQEEIASILKVKRHSHSNKLSVIVGADTEKQAQEIIYAIVSSYSQMLNDRNDLQADQIREKYAKETEFQKRQVSLARTNLSSISKDLGIQFIDPNPRTSTQPLYSSHLKIDPKEKLPPEQQTKYAIAEDKYLAALQELKKIQSLEFKSTIPSGSMDAVWFHNYGMDKEIANFMHNRKISSE